MSNEEVSIKSATMSQGYIGVHIALTLLRKAGYTAHPPKKEGGRKDLHTVYYNKDGVERVLYFRKNVTDTLKLASEIELLIDRNNEEQRAYGPRDLAFIPEA